MENIWRRLRYYGIGFGIGMVFVFFFFQNRGCSWLPSNRVKNAILDRLIVVSDSTQLRLDAKGVSTEDVIQALNDGDVIFDKSEKDIESKVYAVEKDEVTFLFTLPYESFISEVFMKENSKGIVTSSSGEGSIIHFPADENLVFPDSSSMVTCQQEELGLIDPKGILKSLKENGKVDFSSSRLATRPKPEHRLYYVHDEDTIGMTAIWYKNKLNITSFHYKGDEGCK